MLETKQTEIIMKLLIAILLLAIGAFAQNFVCNVIESSFRVELRYMDTYEPEFISYVDNKLWAHWEMNKTSMAQSPYIFVWCNGSETVIWYNYKTKMLRLVNTGKHFSVRELNCKEY